MEQDCKLLVILDIKQYEADGLIGIIEEIREKKTPDISWRAIRDGQIVSCTLYLLTAGEYP